MPRALKILVAAGGLAATAATAHVTLDHVLTRKVHALAAQAGLDHRAITVDPWSGRLTLAGLAVQSGATRISADRLSLTTTTALVSPAQAADGVTVEGVTITAPGLSVQMPRIVANGTTASADDIRAIFTPDPSPLSARIGKITASEILIPELRILQDAPGGKQSIIIYRDMKLTGVQSGVIKSITSAAGSLEAPGKATLKATAGAVTAAEVDAVLLARIYTETAAPGETAPKRLYASFTLDGFDGVDDTGATIKIARMAGADIRGRPGAKQTLLQTLRDMQAHPEFDKIPKPERPRMVEAMTDLFDSVQIGHVEMTGLDFYDPQSKDKVRVKLGRLAYSGAVDGREAEIRVEGFDVNAQDGYARVALMGSKGFSFAPTIAGLRTAFKDPDADPALIDPRQFIPVLGTTTIQGVDMDVPDPKSQERIRLGLAGFTFTAGKPLNGIPTALSLSSDHLTVGLPAKSKEDGIRDLVELGYSKLDISQGLQLAWSETTSDLAIARWSFEGGGMGKISIKGTLGNLARDVFTGDPTAAQIALLGITAKDLSIIVENQGLGDKLYAREAKKQKKSVDQIKREIGSIAAIGIPAALGGGANARALGGAVGKFLANPRTLTIAVKAKDPSGLGFADFALASSDPSQLMEQIDVTATAD